MNHNPSFNMKTKGNGAPNVGHGIKGQFVKQGAHTFPQEAFAARLAPGRLEKLTAQLLGLVNGKGQHPFDKLRTPHQQSKDNRQVLFPVPKVVLEMIALILEGVEGLVFDFPACSPASAQGIGVVLVDDEVGDPTEMAGGVAVDFPVLQEIDPHMGIRLVEGHVVEKAKAVGDALAGELKLGGAPFRLGLGHIVKQIAMIPWFDAQDKAQVVALQLLNVGGVGAQAIFDHNQGQMGMVLA